MAITVNGQIYRNLQEQVQYLTDVVNSMNPGGGGDGFGDVTNVVVNDAITNITEDTTSGMTVAGKLKVVTDTETFEIPSQFKLPIKGDGSIVLDTNEAGNFFTIHLDAVSANKLAKALVIPQNAPATESIVAIDTTNVQSLLTVGNGLKVTGNALASKVTYALDGTTLTITNQ